MNSSPALTLIEILISITIFAIITAVTIPGFTNYNQRRQLDRAEEQVRTELRAMQNQAVSGAEGKRWAIVFDAASDSYRIGTYDGGLVSAKTKEMPGDVDLTSSDTVVFERLTGVSVNGGHTISMSMAGDTRTVRVYQGGNIE